jgi:hypothetical protein
MPGPSDQRDRQEALRLLIVATVALIGLVILIYGGIYFLVENWGSNPFAAGLGLKQAAVIAFCVSLGVILVMALVSGGHGMLGELPFTIAGFLLFFVVFWLMIAWIF